MPEIETQTGNKPSELPEIDLSGLPDKNPVDELGIDLSGLPDKGTSDSQLSWTQGKPEPTFFEKLTSNPWNAITDLLPKESKEDIGAKAVNAIGIADMLNKQYQEKGIKETVSPSFVYDNMDAFTKELGIRGIPNTEEMLTMASMPAIAAGFAMNPLGAFLGLAAYQAISEAESYAVNLAKKENYKIFQNKGISALLPEDTSSITKDVIDTFDLVAKGLLVGAGFKKAPSIAEGLTKNIITEYNLPKTIYIDPANLRTELQTGGVIPAGEMEIIKGLGLTGEQYKAALRDGINLEIPAEKIITIQDKPWYSTVKKLFKLDPNQQIVKTFAGEVKNKPVAGLIEGKGIPVETVKQAEAIKPQQAEITTEQPVKTEGLQIADLEKMFEEDKSPEEFMQMLEGKETEAIPSEKPSELPQEEALLKEPSAIKQEAPAFLDRVKHDEIFNKDLDTLTHEEAKYIVTHDQLTGLKNRKVFDKQTGQVTGMIDLDNFKIGNDVFGHEKMNEFLKDLGENLKQEGLYDVVTRLHGDEFGAKVISNEHALQVKDTFNRALQKSGMVVELVSGNKYLYQGGGASYGFDKDIKFADKALYEDKKVRQRAGLRGTGDFPESVSFTPETEWGKLSWREVQNREVAGRRGQLKFLKDWLSTKEGVVKLKDSEGNVVSRLKSDREQIFQNLSKEYNYSYAQMQNLLDRVINDKPLIDKPKTPASLEKATQFIEDILAKTKDLYAKSEGNFLTSPETKTFKPKPVQQDMLGAKTGLEGKLPSEEIKGKTALEIATEQAQIREAQKGQGDINLESSGLQTLYETLMKKAKVPETAYSDLVELGKYVYDKGGNTASSWMKGMKEHLGKLWDTFKDYLLKVWNEVKKIAGNQRGSIGREQKGDIKLSEMDKQNELFKVGILESYKAGKEAYKAGNKAGVEAEHIRMQNLLAARKERTELKTSINDLKNMVEKLTESPSVSADYRNKIKALIGEYELTGHYKSTIDKLQATQEYLDKVSAAGENIEIPQRILNKLEILTRVPKDELTLNIVKGLKSEIELLGKLGKTKWASKQALYNAEKEARKTALLDTATPINSKTTPQQPIGSDSKQWAEKYIKLRNYLQKTHVGLRPIDGLADITGMKPMKEALDLDYGNYLTYNDKTITKWYELTKDFSEGQLQRIGAVAIARQEGGLQRLTNIGRTEKEINEIKLTPAEEKAYQFVRAKFEEEFPAVKKYALDVYNADVGQVDNYVSFMSDYSAMSDLEIYERFGQRAEEVTGRKTKTVEQGFKEKRSEISNIKLELNIDKIFRRHMDDVAYMLNMGRDIKQYFEIVNSPEMKAKLGDVGSVAWLQWLDLMARKGGTEGAKRIALLDLLRKNMGAGILAYRLSSFMVQFTSFADSMATIGPEWSFKGATSIATSKEWRNFIMDNFPEIKKAIGDDIAFREFGNGMFANLTRVGMLPLQTFDGLMRSTTAAGVYQKLAEEKGIEVNFNSPDKELIQAATRLMRDSQGSSFFKDQPLSLTTGYGLTGNTSLNKTILQFQSFMLARWENIERQIWRAGIKEKNYNKALMSTLWLIVVAAAMEETIRRGTRAAVNLVTGDIQKEDSFIGNAALQAIQAVPIFGQLISSLSYSSTPVPVIKTAEDVIAGGGAVFKGKKAATKVRGLVRAAGAAGALAGVPGSSQAAQIINKGLKDKKGR